MLTRLESHQSAIPTNQIQRGTSFYALSSSILSPLSSFLVSSSISKTHTISRRSSSTPPYPQTQQHRLLLNNPSIVIAIAIISLLYRQRHLHKHLSFFSLSNSIYCY